ncbi:serine/threonine-protein kinase [Streptomyces sp. TLI_235]|nr:serine/threonine-protein kinase [Streptomyces sp. TLI_235]
MRPVGSKYLIEESLGRGATGTVFRGRVRDDAAVPGLEPGRSVAVKVLREELATDPDVVMRFLRERSVLLRLSHPNIVRVRDLVVEGELLALVMDLVEGPDLFRYLRSNGPLSPIAGALLMAQIADALAVSHADGVVHRDLKPANVLLATTVGPDGSEQMHPMLTDFGIARLADSPGITRTHEFVGTPAYVAPESAEGRPQTAAVDVYGAGIMLYELVTGRPPFQGDGPIAVLQAHLAQEPERPRSLPEPLWTVIERCLRKSPAERPTSVALAEALRVVAAGIGVHSSPAAVEAALAVGALLVTDPALAAPAPTAVNHVPAGSADATQVLPARGFDPAAATQAVAAPGAEDRTQVMATPPGGAGDRTRVMPPIPRPGPPPSPRRRTPGRPSCAPPATATSRPRSATSTRRSWTARRSRRSRTRPRRPTRPRRRTRRPRAGRRRAAGRAGTPSARRWPRRRTRPGRTRRSPRRATGSRRRPSRSPTRPRPPRRRTRRRSRPRPPRSGARSPLRSAVRSRPRRRAASPPRAGSRGSAAATGCTSPASAA